MLWAFLIGRAAAVATLIFDEVVSGFRYSPGGAQAYYAVTPDLTTLAKVAAGGLPGAAVTGRQAIMSMLTHRDDRAWNRRSRVAQNGTYNGNPVSAAAAIATLELLSDGTLQRKANQLGDELRTRLATLMTQLGVPGTCTWLFA